MRVGCQLNWIASSEGILRSVDLPSTGNLFPSQTGSAFRLTKISRLL